MRKYYAYGLECLLVYLANTICTTMFYELFLCLNRSIISIFKSNFSILAPLFLILAPLFSISAPLFLDFGAPFYMILRPPRAGARGGCLVCLALKPVLHAIFAVFSCRHFKEP